MIEKPTKAMSKRQRRARRKWRKGTKSGAAVSRLWSRCVRIATIETLTGL